MSASANVFTIDRAAELLGEDQAVVYQVSAGMEAEHGRVTVWGPGASCTVAFTEAGMEKLEELLKEHRRQVARSVAVIRTGVRDVR